MFVRFLPIMDFLCFSCVLFMCGYIINEPNSVYATTSTLTMSVAGAISLNIASTSVVGAFAHSDTTTPNINIRTDNGSGYTTQFTYTGGHDKIATSINASSSTTAWTAANRGKLNDCTSGSWTIAIQNNNGKDVYDADVSGDNCAQLTPNFESIGH